MYKIIYHFNLDNVWNGFKIVGDNLDKCWRQDRVDLSELPNA